MPIFDYEDRSATIRAAIEADLPASNDASLTTAEYWHIWRNLPDSDIKSVVLPHVESSMEMAKAVHQFYAFMFFLHWKNLITQKVGVVH